MENSFQRIWTQPAARRAFRFVCVILVAAFAYTAFRSQIAPAPFHNDEAGWISSSFYYAALWSSGDRSFDRWAYVAPGMTGYAWGYLQTHLGQLMLGGPLTYKMLHDDAVDPFFGIYSYLHTFEENRELGAFPSSGTLLSARHISVIYWTVCVVMMFLMASIVANEFAGAVAVAALLGSDSFVTGAAHAMIDAPNGIFHMAIALSAIAVVRADTARNFFGAAVLFGLCCGLACSVKVTGLVFGLGLLLLLYALGALLARFPIRHCALGIVFAFGSALFVIYALNPQFCPSPGEFSITQLKREILEITGRPPIWKDNPNRPEIEYTQIENLSRVLEFPLLYPRWQFFLELSKADKGWGESRWETFHRRLFIDFAAIRYQWVFVVLGTVFALARFVRCARLRCFDIKVVPFLYFAASYGFILLLMKHNWDRYYYTSVVALCLLLGICASEIVSCVAWLWKRGRSPIDRQVSSG